MKQIFSRMIRNVCKKTIDTTILSCILFLLVPLSPSWSQTTDISSVTVRQEPLVLPTYEIGPADRNPIFYTGRVYQGARGEIYPYPLYDQLTDRKIDRTYESIVLENEFCRVCVLPEIGGRILSATDKSNDYEYFYRQHVVKPALIGMLGAWMSGGVEWNIPHHHRPSSFMPIDWKMIENENGSRTIAVGETELRHRMKWTVQMTMYPERSYLEAKVRIMNRSPWMQSILSWANVSVHCNENYQVIFPPSTQHGTGHSKAEFVDWPIDHNVDLSYWKNHTKVSRSVFAWNFTDDFFSGYDHGQRAGTVHVGNHHQIGGKKFFLWGNHANAQMWDQMLTDDDGPYLELMVGAYSDNQPDYSWIAPGEVREFTHYWYPISGIGGVKKANLHGALNVDRTDQQTFTIGFCPTQKLRQAEFVYTIDSSDSSNANRVSRRFDTSPGQAFTTNVSVPETLPDEKIHVQIFDANGTELIAYTPIVLEPAPEPEPVKPTPTPANCETNEDLYLAGLRLEQFHNAQRDPMAYYQEALRRDPTDARVNTVVGIRYAKLGKWAQSEESLLRAIEKLGKNYTVLRDGEPHYVLGMVYLAQHRLPEARDQLWKATWTSSHAASAFDGLARIAAMEHQWNESLEIIDQSLEHHGNNTKAMTHKVFILRKLDRKDEAKSLICKILKKDPLDYWSLAEQSFLEKNNASFLAIADDSRGAGIVQIQALLEMAIDYGNLGAYDEAISLLEEALKLGEPYTNCSMIYYSLAYDLAMGYPNDQARLEAAKNYAVSGSQLVLDQCFPFRTESREILAKVIPFIPESQRASTEYAIGNLEYYLEQPEVAITAWKSAVTHSPNYSLAWRNLGFAYSRQITEENVAQKLPEAITAYEESIAADSSDPRVFTELDILYAQQGVPVSQRLKMMTENDHLATVLRHDDAVIRLCGLYNETGQYDASATLLDTRHFHVWEGGGEVHDTFVDAHLLRGLERQDSGDIPGSIVDFNRALEYPINLEVGRPTSGRQDAKILYYLAQSQLIAGDETAAISSLNEAISDENTPRWVDSELTYYRILAMRKLGKEEESRALFDTFAKRISERYESEIGDENSVATGSDEFSKFGEEGTRQTRAAQTCYLRGLVDLLQSDPDSAKKMFTESSRRNPNFIWSKQISQRAH